MKKRGQITLFIVLGIVILLVIGLFFFIRARIVEKKLLERPVIELPNELKPVQFFAEQCLEKVAVDGFKLVGVHGGYIDPTEIGKFDYQRQTDSDGLMLSENGPPVVYWLYNKAPPKGGVEFASLRPPLHEKDGKNSIEEQVARYVEENIGGCFGNFSSFVEKGFKIKTKGKPKCKVVIVPGKVMVHLGYEIDVSLGDVSSKIKKLYKELSLDLENMYNLAVLISQLEANFSFIEERVLSTIEVFSGVDEDIPPMYDSEFELAPVRIWGKENVKERIKTLIQSYVPLIRFDAPNKFSANFDDPVVQAFYNNYYFPVKSKYAVRFDYLGWPIYFDTNDNGGVIMPESALISGAGVVFGVQRYRTLYDVSFPVLVSITDKKALGGKGYTFSFALEGNIVNNMPQKAGELPEVVYFEESLFCREEQRNSGDVKIVVRDAFNGRPIANVSVFVSNGGESCFVGKTDSTGLLVTKLPVGFGLVLDFVKEGYLISHEPVDVTLDESIDVDVKLYKVVERKVELKKKLISKGVRAFPFAESLKKGWVYTGMESDVEDDEEAVITLRRISNSEDEFVTSAHINGSGNVTMQLVPGIYEVTITIMNHKNLTIPSEKRCVKQKVLGIKVSEKCYTFPEINLESFISGGAIFNNNTKYLILDPSLVYNSDGVLFYALGIELDGVPMEKRKVEDLEQMSKLEEYSKEFYNDLIPLPIVE